MEVWHNLFDRRSVPEIQKPEIATGYQSCRKVDLVETRCFIKLLYLNGQISAPVPHMNLSSSVLSLSRIFWRIAYIYSHHCTSQNLACNHCKIVSVAHLLCLEKKLGCYLCLLMTMLQGVFFTSTTSCKPSCTWCTLPSRFISPVFITLILTWITFIVHHSHRFSSWHTSDGSVCIGMGCISSVVSVSSLCTTCSFLCRDVCSIGCIVHTIFF